MYCASKSMKGMSFEAMIAEGKDREIQSKRFTGSALDALKINAKDTFKELVQEWIDPDKRLVITVQ